jgi:muramidase (phage lysozyme)
MKLALRLSPWDSAPQVCAALPQRQYAAIFQPGDIKTALLDVADCAWLELLGIASNHYSAKFSGLRAWLKKIQQTYSSLSK